MRAMNGDLLSVERGIICHQVNCKGVMGAGLAKAIAQRWPIAKQRYMDYRMEPGGILLVPVGPELYIAHLAGQDGYGRDQVHTRLDYVDAALRKLAVANEELNLPVYFPYFMGCGLGAAPLSQEGKDVLWRAIVSSISRHLPDATIVKQ